MFFLGPIFSMDGSKLLMCCKRKNFHDALVGFNSMTINLASSVKDMSKQGF